MHRRSERIVGFELDHRPDDNAHGQKRLLERMELREQRGFNEAIALVVRPDGCETTLDHVVGGDTEIDFPALDYLKNDLQHAEPRFVLK